MLKDAIANKSAKVGVIGLGYVGIPLIQADSRLIIVAGSDTTATTLAHLFYHIAADPGIAQKLAAGGTPPPGILKRFPAATPTPQPTPPAPDAVSDAGMQDPDGSPNTTPSIDIVA